jgi:hypothetical protein
MTEKVYDLSAHLDVLARWLQQEADELLYAPDETEGIGGLEVPMSHFITSSFVPGYLAWRHTHSPESDPGFNPGYMSRYILDGHTPVPATPEAWTAWERAADCQVALTIIAPHLLVSTVFLGLDHERLPGRPPLVFETLVIRDGHDGEYVRYSTWDAAVQGHAVACESACTAAEWERAAEESV